MGTYEWYFVILWMQVQWWGYNVTGKVKSLRYAKIICLNFLHKKFWCEGFLPKSHHCGTFTTFYFKWWEYKNCGLFRNLCLRCKLINDIALSSLSQWHTVPWEYKQSMHNAQIINLLPSILSSFRCTYSLRMFEMNSSIGMKGR